MATSASRGRHAAPAVPAHPSTNPAAVKGPADYLRAMRRRVWLILAVALPMAIATSIWALRQPRVYQAVAEVTIDPPQYDPVLSTLVSHDIGRHDPHSQESYIPNLDRPAQEQAPGRDGGEQTRPRLGGQPARRPGPRADPQGPRGPPDPQDEHDRRHPRGQGPGADQEAAGGPARRIQERGPEEQRRQGLRDQGVRQAAAGRASRRTWRSSRRTSSITSTRSGRSARAAGTSSRNNISISAPRWPTSRCGSAS